MTLTQWDRFIIAASIHNGAVTLHESVHGDGTKLDLNTREQLTAAREALDRLLACVPVERNAA